MTYEILVGGQRQRVNSALSYNTERTLSPGQLVIVPLREQTTLGVVVRQSTDFYKKTKSIEKILPYKLSNIQLQLMQWLSQYYPSPISSIVGLFLPNANIMRTQTEPILLSPINDRSIKLPSLTSEQITSVKKINENTETNYLLHGVTGSGKTRIYAELAKQTIGEGKSVIALTPEIGLTTPLVTYFETYFGKENIICFHSQLSASSRAKLWVQIATSLNPVIVIGPRSALFLPVKNLGLIVVDESHDSAYKQEQQPFYNATRVSAKLASLSGAKCILGSATPLIGDYYAFEQRGLPIIKMEKTAIKSVYIRKDTIIDLKNRQLFERSKLLSTPLVKSIELALKDKKQTLLFLNRRGSARTVMCQKCGWQSVCHNCDIALTYHADNNHVICHVCTYKSQVPMVCPDCSSVDIIFQTPGTKSIETEAARLFPNARIARYDKDSASGSKLHQTFSDVVSGKIDILIGTQLLAKGLDLQKLSVIGLIQADSTMSLPDFSATERTYQQISQVAGRIGRGHGNGTLYVQTYHPDKPLIRWSLDQNFDAFYKNELTERLQYNFPPGCYLLSIQTKRLTQAGAIKSINKIIEVISDAKDVIISSPAPCFHEKRAGHFYWQVVVRSKVRSKLIDVIKKLPAQTLYNIDPTDLL